MVDKRYLYNLRIGIIMLLFSLILFVLEGFVKEILLTVGISLILIASFFKKKNVIVYDVFMASSTIFLVYYLLLAFGII
ncbi:MAG: hypothetical protein ACTSYT_03925 [Candidatus Asgardarchaeia archaeon]